MSRPPIPSAAEFSAAVAEGWRELSGRPLEPSLADRAGIHLHLLYLWNRRVNLTAIRDPLVGVRRHALESLEALLIDGLPEQGRILDLGSGNGFPALPLLAARPRMTGLLVECSARKVDFLRAVLRETGLAERGQVEERRIAPQEPLPEGTTFVTLRGFPAPESWIERVIEAGDGATALAWLSLEDARTIAGRLAAAGRRAEIHPLRASGVGAILSARR